MFALVNPQHEGGWRGKIGMEISQGNQSEKIEAHLGIWCWTLNVECFQWYTGIKGWHQRYGGGKIDKILGEIVEGVQTQVRSFK